MTRRTDEGNNRGVLRFADNPQNIFDLAAAASISPCVWTGQGYNPSMPFGMCVWPHSQDVWNHTAVQTQITGSSLQGPEIPPSGRCSPLTSGPLGPSCPLRPPRFYKHMHVCFYFNAPLLWNNTINSILMWQFNQSSKILFDIIFCFWSSDR